MSSLFLFNMAGETKRASVLVFRYYKNRPCSANFIWTMFRSLPPPPNFRPPPLSSPMFKKDRTGKTHWRTDAHQPSIHVVSKIHLVLIYYFISISDLETCREESEIPIWWINIRSTHHPATQPTPKQKRCEKMNRQMKNNNTTWKAGLFITFFDYLLTTYHDGCFVRPLCDVSNCIDAARSNTSRSQISSRAVSIHGRGRIITAT